MIKFQMNNWKMDVWIWIINILSVRSQKSWLKEISLRLLRLGNHHIERKLKNHSTGTMEIKFHNIQRRFVNKNRYLVSDRIYYTIERIIIIIFLDGYNIIYIVFIIFILNFLFFHVQRRRVNGDHAVSLLLFIDIFILSAPETSAVLCLRAQNVKRFG